MGRYGASMLTPEIELAEMDKVCFGSEALSAKEWKQALAANAHIFREDRGVLVGISVAKWDAGIGYLYSNAVHPDWRGRGIGTELVRRRVAWLRQEKRCTLIHAHTRIGNEASQKALKTCGFEAIQYVTDFYEDFEDAILWELRFPE